MSNKGHLFVVVLVSIAINLNFAIYKLGHSSASTPSVRPINPVGPLLPNRPIQETPENIPIEVPPVIPEPEFVEVKKVTDFYREDTLYDDILSRSRRPFTKADRDTNAHESTHGINADIRNSHKDSTSINGFYVMNGKGVLIYEPKMRKSEMVPFVPKSLQGFRYPTYVAGQQVWDGRPFYIFDEWVAYVNGASVNVEDALKNRHTSGWSDAVSGPLEFSVYSVAVAMAVEKHDPDYWKTNKQFKNFIHWHLKRSYDLFMSGYKLKEFKYDKQDKYLEALRTSDDAKAMRAFIEKHFGGIWLK